MKTFTSLLLLVLISSFSFQTTCDRNQLFGTWLLVDSYDEGSITVDSLLKTEVISHTRIKMTYQKNGTTKNDKGDYTTMELFTLHLAMCRIEFMSATSNNIRYAYILHLDDQYLITSERGKIYFYTREQE